MNSVALYHLKGGVGKTATAVNLACLAAREGQRTLLWDLDPQGAASFYLRVDPRVKGGAEQLVRRRKTALRAIRGTDFDNLDLLPADFSERDLDLVLDAHKRRKHRLARLASRFAADYDWLILDCAPSISLVSENVFRAVDTLLVPLVPTTLAINGFRLLRAHLAEAGLDRLRVLAFFSMVDRRRRLHREVMAQLAGEDPSVLETVIPYASAIEQMGPRRAPVVAWAPRSASSRAYARLWAELGERLRRD